MGHTVRFPAGSECFTLHCSCVVFPMSVLKIQAPISANYTPVLHPHRDLIFHFALLILLNWHWMMASWWYHLIRRQGGGAFFLSRESNCYCLVWFWLGVGNSFYPRIFICQGSRASECLESSRSIFYQLFFFFLISLLHCPLPEGFIYRCRGWCPKERRLNFSEAFLWISSSFTWGSEEWSY